MSMLQKVWSKMQHAYRAEVGGRLAARGLLYEDLLVETADVKLALSRLPKDVLAARDQRLKRALVLGSQQRYLPDEVAAKIDPFQMYLGAQPRVLGPPAAAPVLVAPPMPPYHHVRRASSAPYIAAVEESKKEEALLGK